MSLPKGLNYDAERNLYRLRLYHKGRLIINKRYPNKKLALYYYDAALNEKKKLVNEINKQASTPIQCLDLSGLIAPLLA